MNWAVTAYLIVGLGNPGPDYADTRHNAGYRVVETLCQRLGVRLTGRSFASKNARTMIDGKKVVLLCPLTYMNESGKSVRACVRTLGVPLERLLVVHDDLDLPLGRIKLARKGGSGGHKGVSSIIRELGGGDFPRLKIGIGRPRHEEPVSDFVLSPFYPDERETWQAVLDLAVGGCELFVLQGVEKAMNLINCRNLADKEV
ncbi:MAG: aminoacyl-tRNA hydrolase [Deltaproteobacteria bacterium]|nr:aminoacyl-tRNA hydrolase [Deltaproteobacteria bacterium]MBW1924933.1 aminoacyl-tRNA hydrolase [Deltaproteobacteria bacterium]MBW1949425.1 aminoacyl-tRNA hydrolase [Deltaproteobacteria bacterium]MBW2008261.1 aminoacyl-tRNA hydrolase [Deltaproteobacteria bacterium]MBW2101221.1 aminoacyl-tRNA hydrolase [Deltaproteobacteria bacterium]